MVDMNRNCITLGPVLELGLSALAACKVPGLSPDWEPLPPFFPEPWESPRCLHPCGLGRPFSLAGVQFPTLPGLCWFLHEDRVLQLLLSSVWSLALLELGVPTLSCVGLCQGQCHRGGGFTGRGQFSVGSVPSRAFPLLCLESDKWPPKAVGYSGQHA